MHRPILTLLSKNVKSDRFDVIDDDTLFVPVKYLDEKSKRKFWEFMKISIGIQDYFYDPIYQMNLGVHDVISYAFDQSK